MVYGTLLSAASSVIRPCELILSADDLTSKMIKHGRDRPLEQCARTGSFKSGDLQKHTYFY